MKKMKAEKNSKWPKHKWIKWRKKFEDDGKNKDKKLLINIEGKQSNNNDKKKKQYGNLSIIFDQLKFFMDFVEFFEIDFPFFFFLFILIFLFAIFWRCNTKWKNFKIKNTMQKIQINNKIN